MKDSHILISRERCRQIAHAVANLMASSDPAVRQQAKRVIRNLPHPYDAQGIPDQTIRDPDTGQMTLSPWDLEA